MRYNLKEIMRRAWQIRKEKGFSLMTALRLAWKEAKGGKGYTFNMEAHRASITAYLVGLVVQNIHDQHKREALLEALKTPCDREGLAVLEGKVVGLCKYAVRNCLIFA